MRRCVACGLIYLSPRPAAAERAAFYPANYEPHAAAMDRGRRRDIAQRVALIKKVGPAPGRVLDVGCATGWLLEALRGRGWKTCGVEPDADAAALARDRRGLDVHHGTLREARLPDAFFDLVCFWHVLEHAPDPRETLAEAARVARPGGTLLVSLPDPGSGMARRFGRHWVGWDVPRHLCLFPRRVLARLLVETGWTDVRLLTRGGRHWYVTMSLRNWAREHPSAWRRFLARAAGSSPVKMLTWPVYILAERLGRGPNLLAIARRAAPRET
ncbi:MAG: class I SAM-dependent methyltransferase [Kiritimatiellae bacterium]|nr:class I SAM-dependent methyltransferase [Kiritimatiellia bacterium]